MMVTLAFKELIKNCLNSIYPSQFPYEMRKAWHVYFMNKFEQIALFCEFWNMILVTRQLNI